MTSKNTWLLLLACPVIALAGSSAAENLSASSDNNAVSFTQLRAGDTLWVDYRTSGCFHGYRAEVMILGSNPDSAKISVWGTYIRLSAVPDTYTVGLSSADRRGLDSLLSVYRVARPSGCTTYDQIVVSLSRGGRRPAPLKFVDGSCESSEHKGVVRLDEIIRRKPAAR